MPHGLGQWGTAFWAHSTVRVPYDNRTKVHESADLPTSQNQAPNERRLGGLLVLRHLGSLRGSGRRRCWR